MLVQEYVIYICMLGGGGGGGTGIGTGDIPHTPYLKSVFLNLYPSPSRLYYSINTVDDTTSPHQLCTSGTFY